MFSLIDNDASLSEISDKLSHSSVLAIDTEFERVNTYYPELCLVQLANGSETIIIDPLCINNLNPLYDLLYQESIVKVLHSAHQDLEIFFNIKGKVPSPLFDTQLVAPLLGYAEGIGYGNLVREVLSIELDKDQARTNWKQRALKQVQLEYAANDVIYLEKVYQIFSEKFKKLNDLSGYNERAARLLKPETYQPDPGILWKKIYAARKLKGSRLEIVKKLAAWREITARHKNRPRKWILSDHALIDIALSQPRTKSDLLKIDKLSQKIVDRYGDMFLEIVESEDEAD